MRTKCLSHEPFPTCIFISRIYSFFLKPCGESNKCRNQQFLPLPYCFKVFSLLLFISIHRNLAHNVLHIYNVICFRCMVCMERFCILKKTLLHMKRWNHKVVFFFSRCVQQSSATLSLHIIIKSKGLPTYYNSRNSILIQVFHSEIYQEMCVCLTYVSKHVHVK